MGRVRICFGREVKPATCGGGLSELPLLDAKLVASGVILQGFGLCSSASFYAGNFCLLTGHLNRERNAGLCRERQADRPAIPAPQSSSSPAVVLPRS